MWAFFMSVILKVIFFWWLLRRLAIHLDDQRITQ